MTHQADAVAKLAPSRVNAILMDLGTGKSRVLLELAVRRQERFDVLVWFCPVAARENTRREVLKHTDLTEDDILVVGARYDDKTVPRDRRIYIVGIETMQSSSRVVLIVNALVTERSFVAVDESTYIKGVYAKRTDRLTRIAARCHYRAIMSGTPITQGVTDLFAQMRFLSPDILGYASFHSFAANHCQYREISSKFSSSRKYRTGQLIATHNHAYIAARMEPYTYQVLKADCLDLPPQQRRTHYVEMSDEQMSEYAKAKEDAAEEAMSSPDGLYSMTWILRLYTRLQSITCGYVNAAKPRAIPHYRIQSAMHVLGELPAARQGIVWSKYRFCQDEIARELRTAYGDKSVSEFHGGNAATRDREVDAWKAGDTRFLVATQASGGHAQTWIESADVLFYADSFKFSERRQAEDRTHRIGQDRRVTYTTLVTSDSIDERIASAVGYKRSSLQAFQEEIEAITGDDRRERVADLVRAL